jgi:ABC-2 type transport system permease protein
MSLLFHLISAQMRGQMQYVASFWIDVISTFIFGAAYIAGIVAGISTFGGIAGWSVAEIAFLYGLVEMSFGLMDMIFSGFDPSDFSQRVRMGELNTILLRPASIWTQVLGSTVILRRIGRISEGLFVLVLAITQLDITWTLGKIAYLPLVVLGQVLCYGSLFVVGAALTFWTIERVEAINVLTYGSVEMTSYPMSIYPPWLRHVFTFLVPTIFMNYFPAIYLLGKADPLGFPSFAPFIAPLVGAAMLVIAAAFFRFGLSHYQGTGN